MVLRNERATKPQAKKTPAPRGGGCFEPNSSLLTPQRPLRVSSSFAPRFGPNSTRHVTCSYFSDNLLVKHRIADLNIPF